MFFLQLLLQRIQVHTGFRQVEWIGVSSECMNNMHILCKFIRTENCRCADRIALRDCASPVLSVFGLVRQLYGGRIKFSDNAQDHVVSHL